MSIKLSFNLESIALAAIGAVALGIGVHMARKAKKTMQNVTKAIDDLADKTPAEVSEEVIRMAAEKAADKAAERSIEIVRRDINTRVYNTVSSAYSEVEEEVRVKLSAAVEKEINLYDVRKSVEATVTSKLVEKLMTDFSDYIGPFMAGFVARYNKINEKENN